MKNNELKSLFTVQNVTNWVDEYKEDPGNFNFKKTVENLLGNSFSDDEEFEEFVVENLVKAGNNTDAEVIKEHADLLIDFIALLDDQGINLEKYVNPDLSKNEGSIGLLNELIKNYMTDEGYGSSDDEDDLVHDALHPEKFHTLDEIAHENDVHVDGVDDDRGFNDDII